MKKPLKPEHMPWADWRVDRLRRLLEVSEELERLTEQARRAEAAVPSTPRGPGRPRKSELEERIDLVRAERITIGAAYREACLVLEGRRRWGLQRCITEEMANFMHRSSKTVEDMRSAARRRSRRKPG